MELQQSQPQPRYWQSLDELKGRPDVLEAKHHEFQKGVTDDFDVKQMSGISRRRFLAAMGASAAFALASCKSYLDQGEVVPYNEQPEELIIGHPNYYASVIRTSHSATPALVKTREGRPLMISGNPDHPFSHGGISTHAQARIMGLYDPERLKEPMQKAAPTSWTEVDGVLRKALAALAGEGKKGLVLTHCLMSPSAKKALDQLVKKYPQLAVHSYTHINHNHRDAAWQKSYGQDAFPALHWDKADIILALEADFLGVEGDADAERRFASRRDIMNEAVKFNRLYVAEGNLSITGMNADYRLRLRPDAQYAFVMALAQALGEAGLSLPGALASKAAAFNLKQLNQTYGLAESTLKHLVADLVKAKGKALIYAGDRLPESVHLAVNALNEALGAEALYDFTHPTVHQHPLSSPAELKQAVADMNAGQVGVVIHWGTNPSYHLAALDYAEALKKVPLSVMLSTHANETSAECTYTLPVHHDLEAWGDYETHSGLCALQQPVVAPLHKSRQAEGLFLTWAASADAAYSETLYLDFVRYNWQEGVYRQSGSLLDFQNYWRTALHDGFVTYRKSGASKPAYRAAALNDLVESKAGDGYVLSLHPAYATLDGEFADHGWLQEIPHPVSKVVWDNYAAMSVATARELGVKTDELVQLDVEGKTLTLPVLEQPGMAEKVIAVELGYGRTQAGTIGSQVGFDANPLIRFDSASPMIASVNATKASGKHRLVTTQLHHAFDVPREQDLHFSRQIVNEGNYGDYLKDPHSIEMHVHKIPNITKPIEYKGIKWSMAIDMNKCTGCSACIMACNVENNIPVVGPEQVDKGREMHWMRLDRYYSGSPEEPKISLQIMLCQHCDNAPCEVVCPVNATNHSDDGLNQMAYNRCVGTRYCSNNCHYKVRRFNFFNYRDEFAKAYYSQELHQLQHNPEVTVRSRGVMEKCTFCVQRIMWSRQEAIREKRDLKGTDVTVACQEVCPSGAIVFGDANDKESAIYKYQHHATSYKVLEALNAAPSVTYVTKLRNTHEKV